MYTCIPSHKGVTLVGMPKPMQCTTKLKRLSQGEYEAYKAIHELEEVK